MPKLIENTERISTFISKEAMELLRLQAKKKGMSVSGYVRMLILEAVSEK